MAKKRKILVIENNAIFRMMFQYFGDELKNEIELKIASNGASAKKYLENPNGKLENFDLIISDLLLPYKDGATTISEVYNSDTKYVILHELTDSQLESQKKKYLKHIFTNEQMKEVIFENKEKLDLKALLRI